MAKGFDWSWLQECGLCSLCVVTQSAVQSWSEQGAKGAGCKQEGAGSWCLGVCSS